MSNLWSWSPAGGGTSNSMYGNFPTCSQTASGNNLMNSFQNGQFNDQLSQNSMHPGYQIPSFTPPAAQVVPAQQARAATPPPPAHSTQSPSAVVPASQQIPSPAANVHPPQVENSMSTEQQGNAEDLSIEYLHGDAALAYLQQMKIPTDYTYQSNQPYQNLAAAGTTMNPSTEPTSSNVNYQQQIGSGDAGIGTTPNTDAPENNVNTFPAFFPKCSTGNTNTAATNNIPPTPVQSTTTTNHSATDPSGQVVPEASKAPAKSRKLQSCPRFAQQVCYEGPPLAKPSPNPKPIEPKVKPTVPGKRGMSAKPLKPTFHLCGRCIKCKAIESIPTVPNAVMLNPLTTRQKNTSMGRQVSTIVFPNNM